MNPSNRLVTALSATTVFIGAFALFCVQPLVARAILPAFGGAASVWTACLLFFQVAVLAGYFFAHLTERMTSRRRQTILRIAPMLIAVVLLPVLPDANASSASPVIGIFLALTAAAGLPALCLASAGPVIQSAVAKRFPSQSPYWLYALSNIGSFAALLGYPLIIEPRLSLATQSTLWSWSFALFVLSFSATLILTSQTAKEPAPIVPPPVGDNGGEATSCEPPVQTPRGLTRVLWLIYSMIGVSMMMAVTNHLCRDIASVPLLWALPLSVYLLSFVVAFRQASAPRRWVSVLLYCAAAPAFLFVYFDSLPSMNDAAILALQIGAMIGALFIIDLVCHRELYRLRPAPSGLTGFYLTISVGGALGGVFVGVAAPLLFVNFMELGWSLFALAVALIAAGRLDAKPLAGFARTARKALAVPFALAVATMVYLSIDTTSGVICQERNFYGIIRVRDTRVEGYGKIVRVRDMRHGTTLHGRQAFVDHETDRLSLEPTSYYSRSTGVGLLLETHRIDGKPRRIGAIGLGAGTIASYVRAEDSIVFFEIDPAVERIARRHFTFLSECRGCVDVVIGDGRMELSKRPPDERFDILVIDAFSSDSIPVHLLTREAFALYDERLKPDGAIAVHLSNRYLDLKQVAARLAADAGFYANLLINDSRTEDLSYPASWMILNRNVALNEALEAACQDGLDAGWLRVVGPTDSDIETFPLWTDDYSSIVPLLK